MIIAATMYFYDRDRGAISRDSRETRRVSFHAIIRKGKTDSILNLSRMELARLIEA